MAAPPGQFIALQAINVSKETILRKAFMRRGRILDPGNFSTKDTYEVHSSFSARTSTF